MLQLNLELPRKQFTINVDLSVQTGSTLCLFGPSATGKSSILSAIAGFEKSYSRAFLSIDDNVLVDSNARPRIAISPWHRKIGYMEQSARLFPHLNVEQNILYGVSGKKDKKWLNRIIETIGLQDDLSLRSNQLSGGMAQRVALARALAVKPHILLLDEPFSALDWKSRRKLQDLVQDIHQEFSMTMILVTHQLTEAQKMADQIALIDQGVILQTGTPKELVENPVSWKAAQLVGYTSVIQRSDGKKFMVHPDRVAMGSWPEIGIPIEAVVKEIKWYEGRRRVLLSLCQPWSSKGNLEINLSPMDNISEGEPIKLTMINPPCER